MKRQRRHFRRRPGNIAADGAPVPPRAPNARVARENIAESRVTDGPRLMVEQAASDIRRGLVDTDLHGTPSNVPGPAPVGGQAEVVSPAGGGRPSYAPDQAGRPK